MNYEKLCSAVFIYVSNPKLAASHANMRSVSVGRAEHYANNNSFCICCTRHCNNKGKYDETVEH